MSKKKILKELEEKKKKDSCKHYTTRYCSYKGSCKNCYYNSLIKRKKRGEF